MAVSFLTGGGGNFTPIVKYDARMGTFSLRVRNEVTQEWEDEKIDPGFSAIWDLENFEIGWAQYSMTGGPRPSPWSTTRMRRRRNRRLIISGMCGSF